VKQLENVIPVSECKVGRFYRIFARNGGIDL